MDAFWDYHSHDVYREDTFLEVFVRDLEQAKGLVILLSPFLTVRRLEFLQADIRKCIRKGLRFCVLVQARDERYSEDKAADRSEAGADRLRSLGVHVTFLPSVHEKLAVIDETILWEASINVLSHRDTSERINRFCGRIHAEKAIKEHNLYACEQCCNEVPGFGFPSVDALESLERKQLGEALKARRISFGLSQTKLAELVGLHRNCIAKIESGEQDARLSTIAHIYQALNLRMRLAPTFLLPQLDRITNHALSTSHECLQTNRRQKRCSGE